MMAESDIAQLTGASYRELRGHRCRSMEEGVHYKRDFDNRGQVVYLAAGIELLKQVGIDVSRAKKPEEIIHHVVVTQCPHNRPKIINPRVLIGKINDTEVTMRCRDNTKFIPGMEVPCDLREGIYYVRRHPRFKGKW